MLMTSKPTKNKLSLALMDQQWTVALKLVQEKPKLASHSFVLQGFFEGLKDATVFPLHQACACPQVPVALIEALIQAFPAALYKPESSYQRIPLHCACRTGARPAVIAALLRGASLTISGVNESDPAHDMCLQKDNLQRIPLHYALSNQADAATVRLLLEACPISTHAVDQRGWTPLHVAASCHRLEVLRWLLEANPAAASAVTLQGSLPQQVLQRSNPQYAVMLQLLKDARNGITRSPSLQTTTTPIRRAEEDVKQERHTPLVREWEELMVYRSVLV
jgi:ankyrin repeat protein